MQTVLDHIVFAAPALDEGARWLEERLGVPLDAGGEHVKMGTHNRLLRIGERAYLELIAIDPRAPKPARPRWFGLDEAKAQAGLEAPQLLTWVARTSDIAKAAGNSPIPLGPIHAMSRGSLEWLITIPDDGALVEGGAMPALIQWPRDAHPAESLPHRGVSLTALELGSPNPNRLCEVLAAIGLDLAANPIRVVLDKAGPRLKLSLSTPRGPIVFDSARP